MIVFRILKKILNLKIRVVTLLFWIVVGLVMYFNFDFKWGDFGFNFFGKSMNITVNKTENEGDYEWKNKPSAESFDDTKNIMKIDEEVSEIEEVENTSIEMRIPKTSVKITSVRPAE